MTHLEKQFNQGGNRWYFAPEQGDKKPKEDKKPRVDEKTNSQMRTESRDPLGPPRGVDKKMINRNTCWRCDDPKHKQKDCKEKESHKVRDNMYKYLNGIRNKYLNGKSKNKDRKEYPTSSVNSVTSDNTGEPKELSFGQKFEKALQYLLDVQKESRIAREKAWFKVIDLSHRHIQDNPVMDSDESLVNKITEDLIEQSQQFQEEADQEVDEECPKPDVRPLRRIEALVQDTTYQALLDTGAQSSTITKSALLRLIEGGSIVKISKPHHTVRYANGDTELCSTVKLKVDCLGLCKYIVFTVLNAGTAEEVIFGLDIIEKMFIPIPAITRNQIKEKTKDFQVKCVEDILREEDEKAHHGVSYHPDVVCLMKYIEEAIKRNEATHNMVSTVGEIAIEFNMEEDRKRGSWSRQMPIPADVGENFMKQVLDWVSEGICEEQIELDAYRTAEEKNMGLFNTNCFLVYSGKWRFVHNFVPINKRIKNDTNDLPGIDQTFKTISESGASCELLQTVLGR